ncbi:uncharacterized protein LOC119354211 isoform X1 [Triticum dicoccoides]|uniref:uncharacterized protein LOC119354211 isoform X1 n=1 Tax=Triticum dicoccoides TaxID=85692 RepID=UPI001890364E|nr:uncharacterized protein LOC119354211 isoform X1 [Triticum dicoccoides]
MITIMSPLTSEEHAPSSPLSTPEEPASCLPEFLAQRSTVSPTVATTEVAKASNPTQVEAREVRLSDLAPMMLDDTDVQTMLSVGCPLLLKFYHHLVVLESRDNILSSAAAKPRTPLYPSISSASRLPNMNTSSIFDTCAEAQWDEITDYREISVARFLYNYSGRFQKFVEHMIYKNKIFCQAQPCISTISQAKKYSWEIYRDPEECAPYGTTLLSSSHYHILVSNRFKQFSAQLVRSWNLHLNEQYIKQQKKEWSSLFLCTKMPYKHSDFGIAQAVCI